MPVPQLRSVEYINRWFKTRTDAILSDESLSPEGRQPLHAEAWRIAETAHRVVRDQIEGAANGERRDLEKRYLGVGDVLGESPAEKVARAASFRDAMDRAEATERGPDLAALMSRAAYTQDELQERAALTVAVERQDIDAMNVYLESHPEREPNIQRLIDLRGQLKPAQLATLEMRYGLGGPVGMTARDAERIARDADADIQGSARSLAAEAIRSV